MKLLLALLLTLQASAKNFDLQFVDRLAVIESNGNPKAIGDKGRSLGAFQMSYAAWRDVSAARKSKGLPTYPWADAFHFPTARIYAGEYLTILRNRLTASMKRQPTSAELYAAFSHGFAGFQRRGFSLSKCAPHVQRKARSL